jgi:hypothetical protein
LQETQTGRNIPIGGTYAPGNDPSTLWTVPGSAEARRFFEYKLTRVRSRAVDFAWGIHSNIPECCVRFYVDEWDDKSAYANQVRWSGFKDYIPCPDCLRNNRRNVLHVCDPSCGRFFALLASAEQRARSGRWIPPVEK